MNKFLMASIAAGLWANALVHLISPAHANDAYLASIAHDIHGIYSGMCLNSKLC
jgi:hypothetical protein